MALTLPPKATDRAFSQLAAINAQTDEPQILRIAVDGGGCSGFQYRIELIPAANKDDILLEKNGACIAIDPVSVPFLENAEIDYSDELIGARFVVNNPNASSSCGCGVSFSM